MLRQALHEIRIPTRGRGLYDFTGKVADWVAQNGFTRRPGHPAPPPHFGLAAHPGKCRPGCAARFGELLCAPRAGRRSALLAHGRRRRRHARPRAHRADGRQPFHSRQPGPAGAGHLAGNLPLGTSPLAALPRHYRPFRRRVSAQRPAGQRAFALCFPTPFPIGIFRHA